MMGPLADEEKRRLRLLSSICVDFINGPHGRVRDKRDRIAEMRRDGRMNGKGGPEYISTGEAAKMLGTSRLMVQHHFDVKTLKGKKHPITGWRFVSRESVIAFMKKKGVKVD